MLHNTNNLKDNISIYLPVNFNIYSVEQKELIIEYINNLNIIEKKAYLIAMDHLGTSFNVLKSNGFNEWSKQKK